MAPQASLMSPKQKTPARNRHEPANGNLGYFGLSIDGNDAGSSGARVIDGSSNSSIRSAAASPPHTLPFHSTPSLDAFRQATVRGSFSLNQPSVPKKSKDNNKERPPLDRKSGKQEPTTPKSKSAPFPIIKADTVPPEDLAASSRSPNKRLLSSDSSAVPGRSRNAAFANSYEDDEARASGSPRSKYEKHPRLLDADPYRDPTPPASLRKSDTMPATLETEMPTMISAQYLVNVIESSTHQTLVLDLRGSSQYAQSHITGALNLCVPTTLLKRPSYHVSKLAETFKDDRQRTKFEQWGSCKGIVVYDSNSSQLTEAACCVNVLKKFASEGWEGDSYIVRGGFFEFSRKFPGYLERGSETDRNPPSTSFSMNGVDDAVAPVIGGCPMPDSVTKTAANPFFGNIRQNMDLIGGVGQIQISVPPTTNGVRLPNLPRWLRQAVDESNEGKEVSEKFLQIEKREQRRMQEALSGEVVYNHCEQGSPNKIQIAGIEKGSKNRYNNIWPFEHTRVKLQGVPSHGCDYVNANFIQSSFSNKRFIATQGPIPATFGDFWNVVWQRNVRVVVMLTAEMEGGQIKAHNYWDQRSYGPLKLHKLSEKRASLEPSRVRNHRARSSLGNQHFDLLADLSTSKSGSRHHNEESGKTYKSKTSSDEPHVLVRKFTLSHEGEPFERMREITHLQYSSWPDFGAPAHPAHLLGLVEQCDAVVTADRSSSQMTAASLDDRPVLVHCSAGCGRTGTFCTVDTVIDILKKQMNFERSRSRQEKQRAGSSMPLTDAMDTDSVTPSRSVSTTSRAQLATANEKTGVEVGWLARDDIDWVEKTVEEFRVQRLSMVQSLRQFVLCYETILEWLSVQST